MSRLDPRRILASPLAYRLVQGVLAGRKRAAAFSDEHLRAEAGARVLDIGCGPGDQLAVLPRVEYLGFDLSCAYIEDAQRRWGHRGNFFQAAVSKEHLDGRTFDLVIANGVLHHLSDEDGRALIALSERVLAPGGRLVTRDPVLVEGQHPVARWIISRDRGEHVRGPDGYADLARSAFAEVHVSIKEDSLRIPYSHAVMACFKWA